MSEMRRKTRNPAVVCGKCDKSRLYKRRSTIKGWSVMNPTTKATVSCGEKRADRTISHEKDSQDHGWSWVGR